jgi:hypothetical protein
LDDLDDDGNTMFGILRQWPRGRHVDSPGWEEEPQVRPGERSAPSSSTRRTLQSKQNNTVFSGITLLHSASYR